MTEHAKVMFQLGIDDVHQYELMTKSGDRKNRHYSYPNGTELGQLFDELWDLLSECEPEILNRIVKEKTDGAYKLIEDPIAGAES